MIRAFFAAFFVFLLCSPALTLDGHAAKPSQQHKNCFSKGLKRIQATEDAIKLAGSIEDKVPRVEVARELTRAGVGPEDVLALSVACAPPGTDQLEAMRSLLGELRQERVLSVGPTTPELNRLDLHSLTELLERAAYDEQPASLEAYPEIVEHLSKNAARPFGFRLDTHQRKPEVEVLLLDASGSIEEWDYLCEKIKDKQHCALTEIEKLRGAPPAPVRDALLGQGCLLLAKIEEASHFVPPLSLDEHPISFESASTVWEAKCVVASEVAAASEGEEGRLVFRLGDFSVRLPEEFDDTKIISAPPR